MFVPQSVGFANFKEPLGTVPIKQTPVRRCARREYIAALIRETNARELRERAHAVFLELLAYV